MFTTYKTCLSVVMALNSVIDFKWTLKTHKCLGEHAYASGQLKLRLWRSFLYSLIIFHMHDGQLAAATRLISEDFFRSRRLRRELRIMQDALLKIATFIVAQMRSIMAGYEAR